MDMEKSRLKRGTRDEGRGTSIVYHPSSIIHSSNAFTLVELLITTAILGMVSLAIVSTFASGINIYSHLRAYTGIKTDVLLALEKIERDLSGAFVFSEIEFYGDKRVISFPGLVGATDAEGEQVMRPGRISYYFDVLKDELVREKQDYSKAILGKYTRRGSRKVLASVEKTDFSYYYYDSIDDVYGWRSLWKPEDEGRETRDERLWMDEEKILLGARIEVTFKAGGKDMTLSRTVFFPTAVSYHRTQLTLQN